MKNRKGFTIVELVIVIAVIAILAAVLIPTFSSVTASAKASAAQQQAKAGLDSILALTGGVLPSGTLFCITEGNDPTTLGLNYIFEYKGNKLQQDDIKSADTVLPHYAANTYAVYVTAGCWGDDATTVKPKVAQLLLKTLQEKDSLGSKISAVSIGDTKTNDYYTATVTVDEGETAPIVNVYYTTDIQETMIVFIGANN